MVHASNAQNGTKIQTTSDVDLSETPYTRGKKQNGTKIQTTSDVDLSGTPYTRGKKQNEYGDKTMYHDVSINTKNFKIDNFWSRFSDSAEEQSNFTNIATAATVKLTIENSFACKDGGLPEEGCSGQKPFLINNGTLNNAALKLDGQGNNLPNGEYRIPFDSAANYTSSRNDAFYALDVYRDGKFYQDTNTSDYEESKPKTFFGYMLSLIKNYFSPQNDTTVISALTTHEKEIRNRYMANITFGLQQSYRIKKDSPLNTNTNTINAATPEIPSLLDYNALMINDTTGCDGAFFSYNPDSLTCKFQNFFGMSQWMPFFGNGASLLGENSSGSTIQSDSVVEDTETILLTLASKLDDTNYIQPKIDPNTGRISLIGEMFKPMTYMMGSMFRFFFGESSKTLTETVAVDFNFTNPMPLTFIKTNGNKALDFVYFKLLGLESVYGTEVEECTVKQTKKFFFFPIGWEKKTFREGVASNTEFDMNAGFFGWASDSSEYDELNVTTKKVFWSTHDIVNLSTDDWLNWCKRNQGKQKKGLFGRFFDTVSSVTSFVLYGKQEVKTYDDQVDKVLKDDDWSVESYKEKVHKGLILHLKKIDIDNINAATSGTTTKFKIMNISRGH
jgi:hypothetical protein